MNADVAGTLTVAALCVMATVVRLIGAALRRRLPRTEIATTIAGLACVALAPVSVSAGPAAIVALLVAAPPVAALGSGTIAQRVLRAASATGIAVVSGVGAMIATITAVMHTRGDGTYAVVAHVSTLAALCIGLFCAVAVACGAALRSRLAQVP